VLLSEGDMVPFALATDSADIVRVTGRGARITMAPTLEQAALLRGLEVGMELLIEDGRRKLQVVERVTPTEVWTRVVVGGRMKARQGVNVPGLTVDCPALTVKDIADAEFLLGLEPPVDYIALSFVQSAADLQAFIDLMDRLQVPAARRPKLCPKIEKPQALANLGGILGKCGALMVARGDLGVEVGPRRGRTAVSEEEAPVLLVNPA
jgi:pyruvate kinase